MLIHDDVIKWRHFPRYWPFVRGIHRSRWLPRTKASDAEILMFSLIYAWINDWVNNREAGDLRRHRGHCDVNVMLKGPIPTSPASQMTGSLLVTWLLTKFHLSPGDIPASDTWTGFPDNCDPNLISTWEYKPPSGLGHYNRIQSPLRDVITHLCPYFNH